MSLPLLIGLFCIGFSLALPNIWLHHNGYWYMYYGRDPPPGIQPPRASQMQQNVAQISTRTNGGLPSQSSSVLSTQDRAKLLNRNRAQPLVNPDRAKLLNRNRVQPSVNPDRTKLLNRNIAQPAGNPSSNQNVLPPSRSRVPPLYPSLQLASPPRSSSARFAHSQPDVGPMNPLPMDSWDQQYMNNRNRYQPVVNVVPTPFAGPYNPQPSLPVRQRQPNIVNSHHGGSQAFHPGTGYQNSGYPGHMGGRYPIMEAPDVDLPIIPCGESTLLSTTTPPIGVIAPEPRCRCEDAQDCEFPSKDPVCPRWSTCCCTPLPPTTPAPPTPPAG